MKPKFSSTRGFLEVVLQNLSAPNPKIIRQRGRRGSYGLKVAP